MEGLIFGGAHLRREIDWASLIGEVNLPFLLCFTLYLRAYIWRGDLTNNVLRYRFGGLIFGGAHTWRSLFSEFYGPFLVKTSFICMRMENPFHINVHFGWLASHQGCIEYLHNGDNE